MERTIIKIDDEKCNGCGICIPDCPEGALQMIDGKARLVSDLFCDGLGACIGTCPQGAISTEVREADAYDERRVMEENIIPKGENTIKAHLKHLKDHNETVYYQEALEALTTAGIKLELEEKPAASPCGCPSTLAKVIEREADEDGGCCGGAGSVPSQLRQWPVELHLLNPDAQYFKDADLLVAADCTAFSYGDFHRDFIQGKAVVMFCPKLDNSNETYIERMTEILSRNNIKSITIARMEVPCCGGTTAIVQAALKHSGKDIPLEVKVISISGEILS